MSHKQEKGLIMLAIIDLQELQEIAQINGYKHVKTCFNSYTDACIHERSVRDVFGIM